MPNRKGKQTGGSKNPIRPQLDVQKHLKGMNYPASRDELLEHARDHGANDDVLDLLEGMPDKEYKSPVDVTKAVSGES